jgi:FkbM family methyltransferase
LSGTVAEPQRPRGSASRLLGGAPKQVAKRMLYRALKLRAVESKLANTVATSPGEYRELWRKLVPQPYSYQADEVREVSRYGLDWRLAPHDYFQWHQYYGFSDDVLVALVGLAPGIRTFIDVGANIGFYSGVVAATVPSARVCSFEPNPETAKCIEAHCRINGLDNVRVYGLALADKPERRRLQDVGDGEPGKFTIRDVQESKGGYDVEVAVLDDIVVRDDIQQVDLMKIDVEGFEPEVVIGAERTLRRDKPHVCFEYTPAWLASKRDRTERMCEILASAGYAVHAISQTADGGVELVSLEFRELTDGTAPSRNVLAIHPERAPGVHRWPPLAPLADRT